MKREIEMLRPAQVRLSPWSSPKVLQSLETCGRDAQVDATTVFLTGAECPFRCAMCDLWKYTSLEKTPVGAIPFQLHHALKGTKIAPRHWLKLYNASNFFDDRSVPKTDLIEIAGLCNPFERVIVENHPRLCDERMRWFSENISGKLEVAMGLESIHPIAMEEMNKSMTLDDFEQAVKQCHLMEIDVRVFVLLHPPGVDIEDTIEWTWKTVAYAMKFGVRHISIIPLRSGNGWIDSLIDRGMYQLPTTELIWQLMDWMHEQAKVISDSCVIEFDLWDWEQIGGGCIGCRGLLKESILQRNQTQRFLPLERSAIRCECKI
jgi:archaeosine synthase beta-subunit